MEFPNLFLLWTILILNFYCIYSDKVEENGILISAHVIFRHGDRTPISPYPNDPWKDVKYWPTGFGQLTNIGKRQHYELGKWLRKRYNNLVNETYSKEEMHVQATNVDRTLMSALSNLAGFYPPKGKDVWNNDLAWQPIPVHTIPEDQDSVLAAKKPCQAYEYALNKVKKSPEFKRIDAELQGLYEYLTVNTGKKVDSIESVQYVYNNLYIESLYNKTLPEWTKEVYPDKMAWVSSRSFATATYTRQLARLKSGPLLKEILYHFHNKTKKITHKKEKPFLWIYSGHDTTVANMLNTLKVFEYHNPPYTACIMIELRQLDKENYVSVYYKNTTDEPKLLYLPNCGTSCELSKMFELYSDVIPGDWNSECQLSMLSLTYEEANLQPAVIVILGFAITILSILIIISCITMYRRPETIIYKINVVDQLELTKI